MTHSRMLRVAAAQIPISECLDENQARIVESMRRSTAQGVEIIVYPETALTGYSPAIGHGRQANEWPAIEARLNAIAALAAELRMGVILGCEAYNGTTWTNRLYAYDAAGQVVAIYDKIHLTHPDTAYYQPGTTNTMLEMNGIRIGLQICYDVRFPEGYRSLLEQGAEVVMQGFYGAGSGTWKVPVLAAHLRSRAAESGCFMVAANVAGPLQIVVSQIIDPLGLVLAQANQDCEEVITADLDLRRIAESEIRQDYLARFR
jgi:predicted amidohydrolase